MLKSLETLGIDAETRMQTFRVLSGLLHLGNIEFEEDPETPDTYVLPPPRPDSLQCDSVPLGAGAR